METHRNIFLVGLMGAGKTSVGRALAKQLDMRFVDSDHEVEARTGVAISVIFDIEGEASFRKREADVIRDLTAMSGIVLATGGGAVLNPGTRALLHSRGTVIYLRASVADILRRTRYDKKRPLLQNPNPAKILEELTYQREPLYQEIAHVVVDTGRPHLTYIVQSILAQLNAPNISYNDGASVATNQLAMTNPLPSHSRLIHVDLGARSYPIFVAPNALSQLAQYVHAHRVMVVTNVTVEPLYLERVKQTLLAANKQVDHLVLPDGEEYKSIETLTLIFDALLKNNCDRKSTLIALGGGVIGDLVGFAAACYMRGIPFVQLPTTLLAQVDSSVGGKTGINHPLGKNMIGAFYQPQAVLADITTLSTLPARELAAGLAEVIKYGAIIDSEFFNWIELNCQKLCERDEAALSYAIGRCCEIKADIVRLDERESGLRAILNFGHTFGHAIESALGYGTWLHGEAVGCGMVMAADLSWRLGYLSEVDKNRIKNLVQSAGLPIRAPNLGLTTWLERMQLDKKNEGGQIKFVLLKPMGHAVTETVPSSVLEATLQACCNS